MLAAARWCAVPVEVAEGLMTASIVWIDEDDRIWAPERSLLLGLGANVDAVGDATSALHLLTTPSLVKLNLIIMDVMLLQGDDVSIFSDAATNMGRDTGLVLARHLCRSTPEVGRKILFFSRATDRAHVALIERTAQDLNAHYLKKGPKTQGMHFIRWLREHGFLAEPVK